MKHFVIVYDRHSGNVIETVEFSEAERGLALKERFARELTFRGQPDVEVVSLGAESIEDLERTHTRYFKDELRKRAAALG